MTVLLNNDNDNHFLCQREAITAIESLAKLADLMCISKSDLNTSQIDGTLFVCLDEAKKRFVI